MFDCRARLRPAAFPDIAQELAARDSINSGMSDRDFEDVGAVWVLARMKIEYLSYPGRYDPPVTIRTWHKGLEGLYFLRDYQMLGSDGTPLINATSSWVFMDPVNRRLIRSENFTGKVSADSDCALSAIDTPASKVTIPSNAELQGEGSHLVTYSDLDYNGHVNNAKYPVWALDLLPYELSMESTLKSLEINFSREAHLGEKVEIRHFFCDGFQYIEGLENGLCVFVARLGF